MSYKTNFLNKNPIFQEIIEQDLEMVKLDYSKRVLKLDSVIKKVDIQLSEKQELLVFLLLKDDRDFILTFTNSSPVELSKEDIEVYFPPEKTQQLKLEEDLTLEFLEAKEPLLLEQLQTMALLKEESLLERIIEKVKESIKG